MGSSADRCRGQEEGGGRCEKQGVCRLTRGMENRRPCFEVGRSNPSFSGKDINACNSKRNLQGCLFLFSKEKRWNPRVALKMRKTKKKSLFPWKRPQSRCHYVPCYSSVRAGLRNRQQALLMRWVVQIPPSPVKTSTLAIPKGICRDVFFCFQKKKWNPSAAAQIHLPHRKPAESNFHSAGFFDHSSISYTISPL